jgi:chaperonin GroES
MLCCIVVGVFVKKICQKELNRGDQVMTNPSGLIPVEYKVLVKPEEVEEKTEGGIFIPDMLKDREQQAQVNGVIVAVGEMAFEDWKGKVPSPGDKVLFARYAGIRDITGPKDGLKYWVINDKDIIAIIEE